MSVQKRGSKWWVRYRTGTTQRSRTFDLKGDAEAFDRQVKREAQNGGLVLVDRGMITLAEFFDAWWTMKVSEVGTDVNGRERGWSRNTRLQYKSQYARYVYKQLGGYQLRQLEPRILVEWKAGLINQGVSNAVLKKTMTMLSGCLRQAVLMGEITHNPIREIPKPSEGRRMAPWPFHPTEIESIRSHLDTRDSTLVSVLGYVGLRPAEALRMRWEDVHERTLSIKDTKRDRERPALLLPPVAQDLKEWQLLSGEREGLVFPGVDWDNWRKRKWRPAIEEVFGNPLPDGFDHRPYRLRSSAISLLLADSSYSLAEVAIYGGHSLAVMSSYYAGIIAEFSGREISAETEIRKARKEKMVA
ncbi:XerC Integrase [uncultured Caudovirales phage]|uniref:Integrase n=1 Tax=uncultured Caudovirales phage TaxID=2100421 RepID=A0A6J5PLG8_9CAUD|nr:XerC Integrase [uncultured Caudovirales phage]CAB4187739.1 XerC Integrase [uncultured Caudovirales phage]CAB4200489.1 XerC Integrase [uncultured Caudovirales phage]